MICLEGITCIFWRLGVHKNIDTGVQWRFLKMKDLLLTTGRKESQYQMPRKKMGKFPNSSSFPQPLRSIDKEISYSWFQRDQPFEVPCTGHVLKTKKHVEGMDHASDHASERAAWLPSLNGLVSVESVWLKLITASTKATCINHVEANPLAEMSKMNRTDQARVRLGISPHN